MSIRTMLVPLDGSEAAGSALKLAFIAARGLQAHVYVLHVSADPREAVPLLGEGMSGAMIEEMIEMAEASAKEKAATARAMFDTEVSKQGIPVVEGPQVKAGASAAWIEDTGREEEVAVWRGRLSDLIVVGRPAGGADASKTMTLKAALTETGRPVLVAPPVVPETLGRKVAVSWNGSREAARAVANALPLIERSGSVVILTADTDRTSVSMAPELAAYLAWHGISAEPRAFSPEGRGVGEALLKECAEANADLLVLGAYTRSRMRQLLMGGVTSHVLAAATVPLLMTR